MAYASASLTAGSASNGNGLQSPPSALARSFQSSYAGPLAAPYVGTTRLGREGSSAAAHTVTQRSLDRSWASLTSAHRTGGRTPAGYTRVVGEEFAEQVETKRLRELAASTADLRKSMSKSASLSGASLNYGGRKGLPQATSRSRSLNRSTSSVTGRPILTAAELPQLEKPVRSKNGGRQRYGYERITGYSVHRLPNSAVDPALEHAHLLRTFPWAPNRPGHHFHSLADNAMADGMASGSKAGYYHTQWDDPFASNNPYTRHAVEVVNTARPADLTPADEQGADGSPTGLLNRPDLESPSGPSTNGRAFAATALGFGKRHPDYRAYVFERPPANLALEPSAPVARAAHAQQRVVVPLAQHLLAHLPPEDLSATAQGGANLALAVPFNLARFVPLDERDGQGKGGHFLAAGLGYGKGHRNHAKYLHPNLEGKSDLAYYRAGHCT